jgi:hypothetical protein
VAEVAMIVAVYLQQLPPLRAKAAKAAKEEVFLVAACLLLSW